MRRSRTANRIPPTRGSFFCPMNTNFRDNRGRSIRTADFRIESRYLISSHDSRIKPSSSRKPNLLSKERFNA
ncbi:MAG: hypothetical protein ABS79_02030 [Planctomycetes bacterium SCN 63-9]|nr:MAG: hypothetical protein ABS79_02030 [Planctomycetes bacterium SCN 63-9]